MCDFGASLMAVSLAMSAVGMYAQHQSLAQEAKAASAAQDAHNKALEYSAKVQEYNQGMANLEADDIAKRGQIDADAHRLKVRQMIGTQRAAGAGAGAVVDSDSLLVGTSDTAQLGELDAQVIHTNAKRDEWTKRNEAANLGFQANLTRAGQTNVNYDPSLAQAGAFASGASSLLSQGSSMAYNAGFGRASGAKYAAGYSYDQGYAIPRAARV